MADEDRADMLARAIEEMVQGRMPADLDDEEVEELLQIAKIRLDAARLAAQSAADAQSAVLERVIARLESGKNRKNGQPNGYSPASDELDQAPDESDPDHIDVRELQEVIDLKRQMAEEAIGISEAHREAVWQRVQARIQTRQSKKRGGLLAWPFGRHSNPEAEFVGAAMDNLVLGEPIWEAQDSRLEELLRVARITQATATATRAGFADQQARVWARLRPRLMARVSASRRPLIPRRLFEGGFSVPWRKLATAGAIAALVAIALGPLPATGLAHHPVAEFVRSLGGGAAVVETTEPPEVPPVTTVIQSNEVSAAEASELLGLPVFEPTHVPQGYELVSSQYFPRPLTADSGGLFVLAYESATDPDASILVYQESASANSIAVHQGFAQDIALEEGTPATFVSGTWQPVGSNLNWGDEDTRTVLFDLAGVRTIIHSTDPDLPLEELIAIGDSLAWQAPPPTR